MLDEMQVNPQEQIRRIQNGHKKEEFKKLRKENGNLKRELLSSNSQDTYSLLMENYKKIQNKNCDLTLELAGGKTLGVHKAILMGKLLIISSISIHPTTN
jgi:hypothetical protein